MTTQTGTVAALILALSLCTLMVLVIVPVWCFRKRRARKEREFGSGNEEGCALPQGGVGVMAQGRVLLQLQRRAITVILEDIGEPGYRPTQVRTGEQNSNIATLASPTYPESQRHPTMIPDSSVHEHISTTRLDSISTLPDSPSTYLQTSYSDNMESLPLTPDSSLHPVLTASVSPSPHRHTINSYDRVSPPPTTPEPPHLIPTTPVSPSVPLNTVSSNSRASLPSTTYPDSIYPVSTLPSYPGTVRSVSPPAYSDLSRTQSRVTLRGNSRGVSFHTESVVEPGPRTDHRYLEEGRGVSES